MSKCPDRPSAAFVSLAVVLLCCPAAHAEPAKRADRLAPAQAGPAMTGHKLHLGRVTTPNEIAGWNIDVRPDGQGLPPGNGTVKEGEAIFNAQCASCHGEFGEGAGRWPVLAGGAGTLKSDNPVKSVSSYWPYASTLFDYIRRAMPFGNAQSLRPDELYAVTAYVLYLNDVITDESFALSRENFTSIKLKNEPNFIADDRTAAEREFWNAPCMTNCGQGPARITSRARVLDVTPDNAKGSKAD